MLAFTTLESVGGVSTSSDPCWAHRDKMWITWSRRTVSHHCEPLLRGWDTFKSICWCPVRYCSVTTMSCITRWVKTERRQRKTLVTSKCYLVYMQTDLQLQPQVCACGGTPSCRLPANVFHLFACRCPQWYWWWLSHASNDIEMVALGIYQRSRDGSILMVVAVKQTSRLTPQWFHMTYDDI